MRRSIIAALLLSTAIGVAPSLSHAGGTVVVSGSAEVHAGGYQTPPPAPRYRRRPGPKLMAPLRIDIGGIAAGSDYGLLTGAEVSVGIHWASLSPEPTPYDVGVGVFAGAMSNGKVPETSDSLSYGGLYGEFGRTLSGGEFWRTWATGRAEYLDSTSPAETRRSIGVSGKLEAELYLSGIGVAPDGIFFGTYAIGVYVEGAVRRLGPDVGIGQFGAGLTIRTPLVWKWE